MVIYWYIWILKKGLLVTGYWLDFIPRNYIYIFYFIIIKKKVPYKKEQKPTSNR